MTEEHDTSPEPTTSPSETGDGSHENTGNDSGHGVVRVLVGCGSLKRDEPTEARTLYTSGYFTKKRDFAELYGDDWFIVSAKHHVIDPETVIEPYDTSLTNMSADERRSWGEDASVELRALDWDHVDTVVVLMGQKYINPIRTTLETLPVRVLYPFDDTEGNGEQNKWLKNQVQRAKHTASGEKPSLSLTIDECDTGNQTALTNFS